MQPTNVPSEKTARRVGSCMTIVILVFVFICVAGVWFVLNRERIDLFKTTFQLQFNGVKTTGTVASVEEYSDHDPSFPTSSYRLMVEFDVDGKTYSISSGSLYPSLSHSWVGESVNVIYDPDDPNIAMINNLQERWFIPLTGRE